MEGPACAGHAATYVAEQTCHAFSYSFGSIGVVLPVAGVQQAKPIEARPSIVPNTISSLKKFLPCAQGNDQATGCYAAVQPTTFPAWAYSSAECVKATRNDWRYDEIRVSSPAGGCTGLLEAGEPVCHGPVSCMLTSHQPFILVSPCRPMASFMELVYGMQWSAEETPKPGEAAILEAWDDMLDVLEIWPATADGSTKVGDYGGLDWRYSTSFVALLQTNALPFQAINDRQVSPQSSPAQAKANRKTFRQHQVLAARAVRATVSNCCCR